MTPIRQELIAYSKQERSTEQIIRKLLESKTWYAPAGFAAVTLGRTKFDRLLQPIHQEAMPAGNMIYFTDFEAAEKANLPVAFAGEIAGVDLIDILNPAEMTRLDINYGLPTAETFFVGSDAFALLKLWSASIRLEQQLSAAAYEGGAIPFSAMRQHPGFVVAVRKENNDWYPAQVNGLDGTCALAFTAPDRFAAFAAVQGDASLSSVTVSGERLFGALLRDGMQGLVFNQGSDSPITIPAGLFQQVVSAMPGSAER